MNMNECAKTNPWPTRTYIWACVWLLLSIFTPLSVADSTLERLEIATQTGQRHPFFVELATTPKARRQGLMLRRELAPEGGMLFVFNKPRVVTMWMKETYVSLDMLFIDTAGNIVRIAARTTPLSLKRISSQGPVLAVLELVGGAAQDRGIAVGDRVFHRLF